MLARIAVLVLCATAVVQATAVVVFRTPTRIVLAADSLHYSTPPELVCKIQPAGRWWTLTSGFMRAQNPTLNVQDELVAAVAPTTTLAEVKTALVSTLYPRIAKVLTLPSAQASMVAQYTVGNTIASYVVAGQDGGLRAGILGIRVEALNPVRLKPYWLTCPGVWCESDGQSVVWAASVGGPATDRVIERPLLPWVQRADSAAALRLISEQITATPTLVSPPIDVLEISATGAKWIMRDANSACAEK